MYFFFVLPNLFTEESLRDVFIFFITKVVHTLKEKRGLIKGKEGMRTPQFKQVYC